MSSVETRQGPNPDWKAPKKEYCDEDLQAYYVGMLADETVAIIISNASQSNRLIFDQFDQLPIMQGFIEKVTDLCSGVDARLKEKGCYFYESGGSVFMDYKILRNIAFRNRGEQLGETDHVKAQALGYRNFRDQFNIQTPLDDILSKAHDFVRTWNWAE